MSYVGNILLLYHLGEASQFSSVEILKFSHQRNENLTFDLDVVGICVNSCICLYLKVILDISLNQ